MVLCLGQGAGRTDMGLERIAVNINHTDKPDNEGNRSLMKGSERGSSSLFLKLSCSGIAVRLETCLCSNHAILFAGPIYATMLLRADGFHPVEQAFGLWRLYARAFNS